MARVITFSRTFPAYHPKVGQPTYFVEKFLNWYWDQKFNPYHNVQEMFIDLNGDKWEEKELINFSNKQNREICEEKGHTIRTGKRWKVGDKFSPRVWSGKPYNSKQIIIAPDVEIKKVWDFVLWDNGKHIEIKIDNRSFDGFEIIEELYALMHNDGLTPDDFRYWFISSPDFKKKKRFEGQIICWNENIIY